MFMILRFLDNNDEKQIFPIERTMGKDEEDIVAADVCIPKDFSLGQIC